jgi:putative transposase
MVRKTYRFRIFPNNTQTKKLQKSLDACRWLYNHFLEQRKTSWESEKKGLSRYEQTKTIPKLKKEHNFLNDAFSQSLQDVSTRVDLAFRAFFRRVKQGQKPGYPRFRGKNRYDSFCYPQAGFKLLKNVVKLSKIGGVKIKLHRPVEGIIKTCTVRRTPTGKWFVCFVCEIEHSPAKQPIEPPIGLDMGLEYFVTLSNGEHIKNPRFFRKEEKALARAQRKLSTQKKSSGARAKARKVVARVHERINWKRHNFVHQESRKLVNRFNTIAIEDLSINNMQKNNFCCINKSIGDAAWRMFLNLLDYKAAEAGKRVIKVNPAYTSQTCSNCGNRQKLKLSDRVYHCSCCGLSIQRDHNAALNILTLGMQGLRKGLQPLALEAVGL